MIIHWAKFNSEGRTRNPKRTKAQIEAARAEAEKRGEAFPKPTSAKKKKVDSKNGVGKPDPSRRVGRQSKGTVVLPAVQKIQPAEPHRVDSSRLDNPQIKMAMGETSPSEFRNNRQDAHLYPVSEEQKGYR
jgi:hypothetical protein